MKKRNILKCFSAVLACLVLAGCGAAAPAESQSAPADAPAESQSAPADSKLLPAPGDAGLLAESELDAVFAGLDRQALYDAWGQPSDSCAALLLPDLVQEQDDDTVDLYDLQEEGCMAVFYNKDNTLRAVRRLERKPLSLQRPGLVTTDPEASAVETVCTSWCLRANEVTAEAYPDVRVLRSAAELEAFLKRADPDGSRGLAAQCTGYDDEWFAEYALVVVYLRSNSGSVRYTGLGLTDTGCVRIDVDAPQVGTMDMANWVLGMEVPADHAALEQETLPVDFGSGPVTPIESGTVKK